MFWGHDDKSALDFVEAFFKNGLAAFYAYAPDNMLARGETLVEVRNCAGRRESMAFIKQYRRRMIRIGLDTRFVGMAVPISIGHKSTLEILDKISPPTLYVERRIGRDPHAVAAWRFIRPETPDRATKTIQEFAARFAADHSCRVDHLVMMPVPDTGSGWECVRVGKSSIHVDSFKPRGSPAIVEAEDDGFVPASTRTPGNADWMMRDWFCYGVSHIVYGPPGVAKTTWAADLAAIVSRGGAFFNGSRCDPGGACIFECEGGNLDNNLVPQLIASGANMDRVHLESDPADLSTADGMRKLETIRRGMKKGGVRLALLVLSPNLIFFGEPTNDELIVRKRRAKLDEWAAKHRVCVLSIMHQSGTKADKTSGSQAHLKVSRAAFLMRYRDNSKTQREILPTKNNNGPMNMIAAYTTIGCSITRPSDGQKVSTWRFVFQSLKTDANEGDVLL